MQENQWFLIEKSIFIGTSSVKPITNSEKQIKDALALRRATLTNKVPYCTNMSTAQVCVEGIKSLKNEDIKVNSLQDIKN